MSYNVFWKGRDRMIGKNYFVLGYILLTIITIFSVVIAQTNGYTIPLWIKFTTRLMGTMMTPILILRLGAKRSNYLINIRRHP